MDPDGTLRIPKRWFQGTTCSGTSSREIDGAISMPVIEKRIHEDARDPGGPQASTGGPQASKKGTIGALRIPRLSKKGNATRGYYGLIRALRRALGIPFD